jgi:two-component system cell cycle sensor histidine kinase/response regulator CckA
VLRLPPARISRGVLVGSRSEGDNAARTRGGTFRPRTSRLGEALEHAADAVLVVESSGHILEAGGATRDIFGRSPESLRGESAAALCLPAAQGRLLENLDRASRAGRHLFSTQIIARDGEALSVEVSARATDDPSGRTLVCIVRDITGRALSFPVERLRLEDEIHRLHLQLLQSRKLEAVGLLASGMAHDFNNLLNVIMGYAELLSRSLPTADTRRGRIERILQAAGRAGVLTRSLLAFGRKPMQQARVVDVNALVQETEWMIRRLIGEDVDLELQLGVDVGNVKVDPGQLEQVLLNLAVNARQAMLRGGSLTVATGQADPDRPSGQPGPCGGSHVRLTVRDTGVGMDAETQARIFEPFFTTRSGEEGTGLGLATVAGIVHQSGGLIEVESEPGRGASFRIYLPRVDAAPEPVQDLEPSRQGPRGHETILLVEDQGPLREMLREALELAGYRVLAAPDGEAAVRIARRHRGRLDLLATDIVMPRLDGCALARRLAAERPEMRVLFMSGHGFDVAARRGLLEDATLLEKPFNTETLAVHVRRALDRPSPSDDPS